MEYIRPGSCSAQQQQQQQLAQQQQQQQQELEDAEEQREEGAQQEQQAGQPQQHFRVKASAAALALSCKPLLPPQEELLEPQSSLQKQGEGCRGYCVLVAVIRARRELWGCNSVPNQSSGWANC